MNKRWVAIPVLLVLLFAAIFVLFPRDEAVPGDRWSWIDDPADGASIPVAGTIISVGAVDPTGVALLELSANGDFVEGRLFADAPTEVTTEFLWNPRTSGEHQLTVRARGSDGTWGRAATIFVDADHEQESDGILVPSTVPGESTVTAPQSTTTTTSPTTTTTHPATTTTSPSTTTEASCAAAAATLAAPRDGGVVSQPNPRFRWRYEGEDPCPPRKQVIEIGPVGDGSGHVVVPVPPDSRQWSPGDRLRDCTAYSWLVIATFPEGELASATWTFSTNFTKSDNQDPCP